MDIYIGFDSAWTDNPKAPGAICAVGIEDGRHAQFHAPQLVSFNEALTFIQKVRSEDEYANRAGPADAGPKFDQHAAGRTRGHFPH
jgi:predicted RNase H-like nuclease